MFFFDPLYIVLLVVTVGLTGWASWRVRSTYGKWSKVDSGINLDAFDFARRLLDRQGLQAVRIEPTPAELAESMDLAAAVRSADAAVARIDRCNRMHVRLLLEQCDRGVPRRHRS